MTTGCRIRDAGAEDAGYRMPDASQFVAGARTGASFPDGEVRSRISERGGQV